MSGWLVADRNSVIGTRKSIARVACIAGERARNGGVRVRME